MSKLGRWTLGLVGLGVMVANVAEAADAQKVPCGSEAVECLLTVAEPHRAGVSKFLKTWQAKKRPVPKRLTYNTVLFVRPGGDYVYSTVKRRDDPICFDKVRFYDAASQMWFELYVSAEDEKWVEQGRASIEPALRSYVITKGYEPVSKLDFGVIRTPQIGVIGKHLLLKFELEGRPYSVRLTDTKKTETSVCTGGKITKAKSGSNWVVIQFEEPVVKSDWEGGGQWCAREDAALRIAVSQGKPQVTFRGKILQPLP